MYTASHEDCPPNLTAWPFKKDSPKKTDELTRDWEERIRVLTKDNAKFEERLIDIAEEQKRLKANSKMLDKRGLDEYMELVNNCDDLRKTQVILEKGQATLAATHKDLEKSQRKLETDHTELRSMHDDLISFKKKAETDYDALEYMYKSLQASGQSQNMMRMELTNRVKVIEGEVTDVWATADHVEKQLGRQDRNLIKALRSIKEIRAHLGMPESPQLSPEPSPRRHSEHSPGSNPEDYPDPSAESTPKDYSEPPPDSKPEQSTEQLPTPSSASSYAPSWGYSFSSHDEEQHDPNDESDRQEQDEFENPPPTGWESNADDDHEYTFGNQDDSDWTPKWDQKSHNVKQDDYGAFHFGSHVC